MSVFQQADASYIVDQTVTSFALDQFTLSQSVMPVLFDQRGSVAYQEKEASMSGLKEFQEKTELQEPDEDKPIAQYDKTYLHREFALQVKVERKVIDDQQFPFFQKLGRKIGESAMRKMESLGAEVFTDAFTGAIHTAEDSLSLCNGAHVNADGGNSQSNTGTSELSYANLKGARNAMVRYTGYRAEEISVNPDMLLVPEGALELTAYELVNSQLDPSSNNNTVNHHSGRYAVVSWGYLAANDSNNWFLIDSMMMREHLPWFWRIPLEIFGDGSLMKGMRSEAGYFRASLGPTDWRWIYGNNVT